MHASAPMKSITVFGVSLLLICSGVAFAQRETKTPVGEGTTEDTPRPKPVEPPKLEAIEKSISKGVDYLLRAQNKNGSWGSATNTKGLNIYAPVPGAHHAFRAAVTAMAISALIETGSAEGDDKVAATLQRGEEWLLANLPGVRRATGVAIYNTWAHGYGCQALAHMLRREANAERKAKIEAVIATQLKRLESYESIDGGWGYYDFRAQTKRPSSSSISFMTATMLIAFHDLKEAGIEVPRRLVDRGIASINRQRKPDNTYAYGEYLKMQPMRGINRPSGSLGRSQACNLALRLWGDETITDEVMHTWLDRLWARNGWLDMGRKRPIPHESWAQVAGYFYYYGHYYAALGIENLPPEATRAHKHQLATILMQKQEKDGTWWDFPLYNYHQQYGTAFALMSLARCRDSLPRP
jgi:hypothetical protein